MFPPLEKLLKSESVKKFLGIRTYEIPKGIIDQTISSNTMQQSMIKKKKINFAYENTMLEGYKLTKGLGAGAFNQVYLGEKDGKLFAVKILERKILENWSYKKVGDSYKELCDDERFERFNSERRSLETVSDQSEKARKDMKELLLKGKNLDERQGYGFLNVVQIFDSHENYNLIDKDTGNPKDLMFYAMELLEESEIIPLTIPLEDILKAGMDTSKGLQYLHNLNLIHRDIKPANVGKGADGRYKITDFGIARDDAQRSLTMKGDVLGSPGYMSPQNCDGQRLEPSDDLYSLGVTLFTCVTRGGFPYDTRGADYRRLMARISDPKIRHFWPSEFDPSINKDLERVILKSISFDRRDRYQSGLEFHEDLKRLKEGREVNARYGIKNLIKHYAWDLYKKVTVTALSTVAALIIGGGVYIGWNLFAKEAQAIKSIDNNIEEVRLSLKNSEELETDFAIDKLTNADKQIDETRRKNKNHILNWPDSESFKERAVEIDRLDNSLEKRVANLLKEKIETENDPAVLAKDLNLLYTYAKESKVERISKKLDPSKYYSVTDNKGNWQSQDINKEPIGLIWHAVVRDQTDAWKPPLSLYRSISKANIGTDIGEVAFVNKVKDYETLKVICDSFMKRYNGNFIPWEDTLNSDEWKDKHSVLSLTDTKILATGYEEVGDKGYLEAWINNAEAFLKHLVKPDGSLYRHMMFEPDLRTPKVKLGIMSGFNKEGSYTYGYGTAISGLSHLDEKIGDPKYLENAKIIAGVAIKELGEDNLINFGFNDPKAEAIENSAGNSMLAYGFIKLSQRCKEKGEKNYYRNIGINVLKAITTHYLDLGDEFDALLRKGCRDVTRDPENGLVWGDYYFLEALRELNPVKETREYYAKNIKGKVNWDEINPTSGFVVEGDNGLSHNPTLMKVVQDRENVIFRISYDNKIGGKKARSSIFWENEGIELMVNKPIKDETTGKEKKVEFYFGLGKDGKIYSFVDKMEKDLGFEWQGTVEGNCYEITIPKSEFGDELDINVFRYNGIRSKKESVNQYNIKTVEVNPVENSSWIGVDKAPHSQGKFETHYSIPTGKIKLRKKVSQKDLKNTFMNREINEETQDGYFFKQQ